MSHGTGPLTEEQKAELRGVYDKAIADLEASDKPPLQKLVSIDLLRSSREMSVAFAPCPTCYGDAAHDAKVLENLWASFRAAGCAVGEEGLLMGLIVGRPDPQALTEVFLRYLRIGGFRVVHDPDPAITAAVMKESKRQDDEDAAEEAAKAAKH